MTAVLSPIALLALLGTSFTVTALRWRRLLGAMRRAQRPDDRADHAGSRIKAFFVYVVAQARLLRWPYAGILHALIFWGFVVLLTAVAQGLLEAAVVGIRFDLFPLSSVIAFLQDLFCVLVLTGVLMALINRIVINPTRFRGSHKGDAILILCWIGGLLLCMELNYATLIAKGAASHPEALSGSRPFASVLSHLFTPLGAESTALSVVHGFVFWGHLCLVLGFLVYLGYSKHLHIITATFNVIAKNEEPKGRLRPIDIDAVMNAENEADQHFGASAIEHFSWKDVLDLYTCTECGRCQTHCPAYNTGKPLSPKTLITDLRDVVYEDLAGGYAATKHDAHVVQGGDDAGIPVADAAVMWATGDHHPGADHDLPGISNPHGSRPTRSPRPSRTTLDRSSAAPSWKRRSGPARCAAPAWISARCSSSTCPRSPTCGATLSSMSRGCPSRRSRRCATSRTPAIPMACRRGHAPTGLATSASSSPPTNPTPSISTGWAARRPSMTVPRRLPPHW
ncbi:MAG: hypothetical protein ACR2GX_04265 [Candidatus Dormibacteria bacterium]